MVILSLFDGNLLSKCRGTCYSLASRKKQFLSLEASTMKNRHDGHNIASDRLTDRLNILPFATKLPLAHACDAFILFQSLTSKQYAQCSPTLYTVSLKRHPRGSGYRNAPWVPKDYLMSSPQKFARHRERKYKRKDMTCVGEPVNTSGKI